MAILVDFDGTITTRDIGDQVVTKFADPGWESALERFHAGEMNIRDLWGCETGYLREEREAETVAYSLTTAEIRSGFREMVRYCDENDMPVEVASSGIHFYVDAILEAHGFGELARARPVVEYDDKGFGVMVMPDGVRDCGMTAMCKCDRVWRLRRQGFKVMFVGDGASDECAVNQADIVMATGALREICRSKGIEHTPFETFHQVLEVAKTSAGNHHRESN
ncbi:MAG: MtnX-like HAD-IB family phosphatase [Chloroflexi bacterium]|nr:MtnX-like HAD-IB family phosphatase [Chloroflexota bacterium]